MASMISVEDCYNRDGNLINVNFINADFIQYIGKTDGYEMTVIQFVNGTAIYTYESVKRIIGRINNE